MNFKEFFFVVISTPPMSFLIKEKIFIPAFDWGCYFLFAFCFLQSKHLAFWIIRFSSLPLPSSGYKNHTWGERERECSDLEGQYIKIKWRYWLLGPNANSCCLMDCLWQNDGKGPPGLLSCPSNWPLWIFNEIKMKFNQSFYLLNLHVKAAYY